MRSADPPDLSASANSSIAANAPAAADAPTAGSSAARAWVVGIVGAGTMGAGIAQLALEGGSRVLLYDVDPAAVGRATARIMAGLLHRASKRTSTEPTEQTEPTPTRRAAAEPTKSRQSNAAREWVATTIARLESAPDLDVLARASDIVIEAALEEFGAKQAIFARLDAMAPPGAILATNTSALSVGQIAFATNRPERVLGLHFFNPAPIMRLVEVVAAPDTAPGHIDLAMDLVRSWGRTPVRCADTPGFIVNRVNRPFTLEALRILAAGGGTIEGIDAALRADGFPMGPFELMDLVGIDVNLAAARGIYEKFGRTARFRPSPIQERLVTAGQLGRKSGQGFYRYDLDGRALGPAAEVLGAAPVPALTTESSAVEPQHAAHAMDVADVAPLAPLAPMTPGEIVDWVVLAIVNEAYRALGEHVALQDDIDLALRLGAGHPRGPFEQVDRFGGLAGVVARLEALVPAGDARFEPAALLRERAIAQLASAP